MEDLLKNERFAAAYERLGRVSLNPRRHTAPDARAHSDVVAAMAAQLALANGCSPAEVALLTNLGHAHDIGKIKGTARPARSLDVLADCDVTDQTLLSLVKWHDTSLPWHRSTLRGEAPSDKAWRRLANEVDVRLLCLFMVADRVDAPGGWRRNAPTTWFLSEAKARGLVDDLVLDLEGCPSEICAGAALVMRDDDGPAVLVIRTRSSGWELPKGGIEWDELPEEAAVRELREESGVVGDLGVSGELGRLEYFLGEGSERWLKQVRYYLARAIGEPTLGDLPKRTRQRRWLRAAEVDDVPLVSEDLRLLLRRALDVGAVMVEVMTNRDLYCFVAGLVKERSECSGTLQSYLENVRRLGRSLREREAVSLEEFAELLRAAFDPEPRAAEPGPAVTDGYVAWEKRITQQIRDLDEMRQAGTLNNEHRYFGVDAPRGGRWYNFDPCTYLECAVAGTFGGWQEGDDTGRLYVPGPVAVLDASGAITSMDPRDIDDPVVALPQITWEMFVEFLDAGQWYE